MPDDMQTYDQQPQTGTDFPATSPSPINLVTSTQNKRRFQIGFAAIIIVIIVLFFAITNNKPTAVSNSTTTANHCPLFCDDNNACTKDYCNETTNFECRHDPLSGDQIGCSGSALCKIQTCSSGTCIITDIQNCSTEYNYKTFFNKTLNFSISIPDTWQIDKTYYNSIRKIRFVSPQGGEYPAQCSVTLDTTSYFIEVTKNSYNTSINGEQAAESISLWYFGTNSTPVKIHTAALVKNETLYDVGCESTNYTFEEYAQVFNYIIRSFKFGD